MCLKKLTIAIKLPLAITVTRVFSPNAMLAHTVAQIKKSTSCPLLRLFETPPGISHPWQKGSGSDLSTVLRRGCLRYEIFGGGTHAEYMEFRSLHEQLNSENGPPKKRRRATSCPPSSTGQPQPRQNVDVEMSCPYVCCEDSPADGRSSRHLVTFGVYTLGGSQ